MVALAETSDINRQGMGDLLADFFDGLQQLANGVVIELAPNLVHEFHGFLASLLGDTLGIHNILGFKEGVGFALRSCRNCFGDHGQIQVFFEENQFQLRHLALHRAICAFLNGLQGAAKEHYSTFVGINNASIMDNVPGFNLIDMAPQDMMHVLIEGGLAHEMRLFIRYCVREAEYFTLAELNERIDSFAYGPQEKSNRPSPIKEAHIDGDTTGLPRQKAAQIWLLARVLGFLIADLVPHDDQHAQCFSWHLRILFAAFSPEVHPVTEPYLRIWISAHHQLFRICYPDVAITPKLHYCIHIPSTQRRYLGRKKKKKKKRKRNEIRVKKERVR